jgi:hypothetical protein
MEFVPACKSIVQFSGILQAGRYHVDSLKLDAVDVFTPQKLLSAINQGSFPLESVITYLSAHS